MAVTPFHRSPEEFEDLIRGEMRRREQRNVGLPGQSLPRAFMPPVGQPVALASRPGPSTLAAPTPAQPALSPGPQATDTEAAPIARPKPQATQPAAATREPGWVETILGGAAQGAGYYDAAKEQLRKDAMRDPASAESVSMRKRMAPMLAQLGLDPGSIESLSGEDLAAFSAKGDLLSGVVELKQKSAAAKAKAEADAAALAEERKYEEGREETKAKRSAAEWDRQNAIEAPQRLERARTIGGMATGRMIQGALLSDELQRERAGEAEQRKIAEEQRSTERKAKEAAATAVREAETKLVGEEAILDRIEKKLRARPKDETLPGSEGWAGRTVRTVKREVLGGTGMSAEDSSLATDLTAGGLSGYISTAGNAPNSEREQEVADQLLRGSGTVEGALLRVNEKKAELAERKRRLRERAAGGAGAEVTAQPGDVVDPDDYGGEL